MSIPTVYTKVSIPRCPSDCKAFFIFFPREGGGETDRRAWAYDRRGSSSRTGGCCLPNVGRTCASRRGGQTHFLFLCEEKENGFGCQKKKNGAMIVDVVSIARRPGKTGSLVEDAATGRRNVIRQRNVAFLLLPPRPPLRRRTERRFLISPFIVSTTQKLSRQCEPGEFVFMRVEW